MRDFNIVVTKVTDVNLMREACSMTFLGTSKQSLLSIYKSEHSPARTQMFWVQCYGIDLAVATHILRHHVGSIPFQLTCRDDRQGGNPSLPARIESIKTQLSGINWSDEKAAQETVSSIVDQLDFIAQNTDRKTPVNLGLFINAQSIIDMGKLRICLNAMTDTRLVFKAILKEISLVDPDLAKLTVRKCVYRGGICGENACCGFNNTPAFQKELETYLSNFSEKQRGLCLSQLPKKMVE